jgi:hypothetical protein
MGYQDKFVRAHEKLRERQDSPVFEYKGMTVPCVANSYSHTTKVALGGFEVEADLILYVKKTEFVTLDSSLVTLDSQQTLDSHKPRPRSGYSLLFGGRRFKVSWTHDPLPHVEDAVMQLVCVDYNA